MNLIDLIIIAIIGFGIIRGYSKGLIIELSSFFGIFISFFIAGNVDNLLSNEISAFISVNSDLLNTISFITIQTTGDSQDFGDLTSAKGYPSGMSNSTRGVFAGGYQPTQINAIDFVNLLITIISVSILIGVIKDMVKKSINRRII